MVENLAPTRASLGRTVRSLLGLPPGHITIRDVQDISPGIGSSRVFRIVIQPLSNGVVPESLILKVPDWEGETLIDSRDPWLRHREQALFTSSLLTRLPPGLRAPEILRIEQHGERRWIWMEDLASCLEREWGPDDVIEAAQRSALLNDVDRQAG